MSYAEILLLTQMSAQKSLLGFKTGFNILTVPHFVCVLYVKYYVHMFLNLRYDLPSYFAYLCIINNDT